MASDRDILTELRTEFCAVSDALISIKTDIKELVQAQYNNSTEVKLLRQETTNIYSTLQKIEIAIEKHENRITKIENNQNWLLAKVGTITTIITGAITWFLGK